MPLWKALIFGFIAGFFAVLMLHRVPALSHPLMVVST
jgi:hypothetical protein